MKKSGNTPSWVITSCYLKWTEKCLKTLSFLNGIHTKNAVRKK